MRILAVSHNFKREGAPIIFFRLLRALKARHEIHVLRMKREREALLDDFEAEGFEFVGPANLRDYDVMLANTITNATYVAQARHRLPTLLWIHEPKFGLEYIKRGDVDPRILPLADRLVFPTRWQAETLYSEWLTAENWGVVPYGIGTDTSPQPCPFEKKPGEFYLLHLGLVDSRKGQDLSARALAHIGDSSNVLMCVGAAPDHGRRMLEGIDATIRFEGSQPESKVNAYIQHCDAMIFPTRDDLITLAILEGLTFSQCVLASDFGPIPETIHHGETGMLSPVNDHLKLAENIQQVRADPELRARLGRAGNEILHAKHGFEAHVAGMEAALEDAIRRGRARLAGQ